MNEPDTNGRDERIRHTPPDDGHAQTPPPLPREWLPEARAPEGHPVWELRAARVMAAADPALGARPSAVSGRSPAPAASPAGSIAPPWWSEMGRWWKASAGLAAASLLLFFGLPDRPWPGEPGVEGDQFALGMVVAEGDPAGFWHALGVPADPVLAFLTFAEPGTVPAPADPASPSTDPVRPPADPASPPANPATPPQGDVR